MIEDIYYSDVSLYNNVFIDYNENGNYYLALFGVVVIDRLMFIVGADYV